MSFAFGFSEDQLDGESVAHMDSKHVLEDAVLDVEPEDPQFAARSVALNDLLLALVDVRLTYSQLDDRAVYKRDHFDIKHQAMTEDNEDASDLLLRGDSDLTKNQYEGGFKVWECSVDLVDQLSTTDHSGYSRVAEIGCGTALPSCFLLREKFRLHNVEPWSLVLTDYNYDVLRLVTLPNLIINWYSVYHNETEVHVTAELVNKFVADLNAHNITLEFISGAWGRDFLRLLDQPDLVLTSETIYSLETMPLLTKMLLELGFNGCKSVVAAKNFYFGVGGSTIEFLKYLNDNRGSLSIETHELDSQLKRSIITIAASQ